MFHIFFFYYFFFQQHSPEPVSVSLLNMQKQARCSSQGFAAALVLMSKDWFSLSHKNFFAFAFFISFQVHMLVLTLALHTVCHVTGGARVFYKESLRHVSQRKGHLCSSLGTAGGGDSSGFLSLGLPHSSQLTSKRKEATTGSPSVATELKHTLPHSTTRRLYYTSPDITSAGSSCLPLCTAVSFLRASIEERPGADPKVCCSLKCICSPLFVQVVLLQFLSDCKVIEFESLHEQVLRSDKVVHCLSVSSFLQRCQKDGGSGPGSCCKVLW